MVQERGSDYKFNIFTGKLPMLAKMKLEDYGIAKPENFTNFGGVLPENRQMMEDKLSALSAQGYGKRKYKNPYLHDQYLRSHRKLS